MKNMKCFENEKGGMSILRMFLLGIILLLVLSYFNISIKSIVESPTGQENINYVKGTSKSFWDKYFKDPAHYLWQDIWVNLFWKPFVYNMERIRDGLPTDMDKAAENVKFQY